MKIPLKKIGWYTLFLPLSVILVFIAEPLLHLMHIPHPEGWWIPLLFGGGAAAEACSHVTKKSK